MDVGIGGPEFVEFGESKGVEVESSSVVVVLGLGEDVEMVGAKMGKTKNGRRNKKNLGRKSIFAKK